MEQNDEKRLILGLICIPGGIFGLLFSFIFSLIFGFGLILGIICFMLLVEKHFQPQADPDDHDFGILPGEEPEKIFS